MEHSDLKYNYVILSTDWEVYRQFYEDAIGRDDVYYVAGPQATKRGLRRILYRIHFNKALNRLIPLPFKGIWNRTYFSHSFKNKKPLCFILFRDWVTLDRYTDYIHWLKRRYPGSKFVWFLHDMMHTHNDFYTGKVLDIDYYKQVFDLVFTCHPSEASKYGLSYHKVPISKLFRESPARRCDVLFAGKDKGRLPRLIRIYDELTRKGARCRFFVSGASAEASVGPAREGIILLNRPMPYKEVQEWVAQSNCLLELRSDSQAGETTRPSEALIYGKKIITDLSALAESDDFDANSLRILGPDDSTEQVDLHFLTSTLEVSPVKTESHRARLSPVAFLKEIDGLLKARQ